MTPSTLTHFRALGRTKRGGRTAQECKELHDRRQLEHLTNEPRASISAWICGDYRGAAPRIATLMLPNDTPRLHRDWRRCKNWKAPLPSTKRTRVKTIDHGPYSSQVRYRRLSYVHRIECWAGIVSPRVIWYRIDTREGIQSGSLRAPRGWQWSQDDEGICLQRGRADYHPTADDLINVVGVRELCRRARAAGAARIEADRRARTAAREWGRLIKSRDPVRVTVADARRAGNCAAGISQWCYRQLGIRIGRPYQSVAASDLPVDDPRVRRSVEAAWDRETLVAI